MVQASLVLAAVLISLTPSDPAKTAAALEAERDARVAQALKGGKPGEIDRIDAEIAAKALAATKEMDEASVKPDEALAWSQLFRIGKDFHGERRLLTMYLDSRPAQPLGAQMQYLMACFQSDDGAELDRMLRLTKPEKGDAGSTLASFAGGTYHYAVRDALGPQAAIDALDYCAQFIPNKPYRSDESRKSAGWARRQLADAKASYLAELGKADEAVKLIDVTLASLDPDVFRLADLKAARSRYDMIGKRVPAMPAIRSHGPYEGLESLKGRVVALDFTAHWCHACIASLPSLVGLEKEFSSKGLRVLSVTTFYGHFGAEGAATKDMPKETEFEKMPAWMQKYGIDWPMVYVDRTTLQAFGVAGIPQVMLIDKAGVLKSIDLGFSPAKFKRFREQVERELAK